MLFGNVLAALPVGYLAGLWSCEVKNRWCPGAAIYAVRVSPALREVCSVGSGEGWAHRVALSFRQTPSLRGAPVHLERKGRNVGTYEGGDQIDRAQQALQQHAVSSGDGLCLACQVPGPCPYYEAATKEIGRAHV